MTHTTVPLFQDVDVPQGLNRRILARIMLARVRAARIRFAAFGAGSLMCLGVLIPALSYAAHELYASGFFEYTSLIFSDTALALSHWKEFVLTLAESLPSFAILTLVATSGALLWSLYRAVESARFVFIRKLA